MSLQFQGGILQKIRKTGNYEHFNNFEILWRRVCQSLRTSIKLHLSMLIKLNSILHLIARHKEEKAARRLTRKEWINVDRIVIIILFLSVIIGAIIFS